METIDELEDASQISLLLARPLLARVHEALRCHKSVSHYRGRVKEGTLALILTSPYVVTEQRHPPIWVMATGTSDSDKYYYTTCPSVPCSM